MHDEQWYVDPIMTTNQIYDDESISQDACPWIPPGPLAACG